jgi:broad specificity phosphatase PhoE
MLLDLWLVRHGQTDWNLEKRIQGWTDVPLNRLGLLQATRIGQSLRHIQFRAVYSSDLARAQMTAAIIHGFVTAPLLVDPMLRERQFGKLEGQIRTNDIHTHRSSVSPHAEHPRLMNATGDGETDEQIRRRSTEFIQSLAHKYRDGNLLCVTHGGWIRALLEAYNVTDFSIQNASVTRLSFTNDEWQVHAINEVGHLDMSTEKNHPPHAKMGG